MCKLLSFTSQLFTWQNLRELDMSCHLVLNGFWHGCLPFKFFIRSWFWQLYLKLTYTSPNFSIGVCIVLKFRSKNVFSFIYVCSTLVAILWQIVTSYLLIPLSTQVFHNSSFWLRVVFWVKLLSTEVFL